MLVSGREFQRYDEASAANAGAIGRLYDRLEDTKPAKKKWLDGKFPKKKHVPKI